jgi:hypothetical protein
VLNANGLEVFARNPGFDIPDAKMINVRDVALTKNGLLVVLANAWQSYEPGPGGAMILMLYEIATGNLIRIIRTNPVACVKIAADEQQDLWCLGVDVEKYAAREDYELIHSYSLNGDSLSHVFPRSMFLQGYDSERRQLEPYQAGQTGHPQMFGSADGKVYAWLPNAHELLEWDLEGRLLTRAKLPGTKALEGADSARHYYTFAVRPNGTVVATLPVRGAGAESQTPYGVYQLNRSTASWDLMRIEGIGSPLRGMWFIGADDSGLVFRIRNEGKLVWLPPSN